MPEPARWEGRRVLVTGARGFIGAALCRRLHGLGAALVGASRGGAAAPWPIDPIDLGDAEAARALLERRAPEVVFHLAGHVEARPGLDLVLPTLRSGALASIHLMLAAQASGCRRLVLTGSLEAPATGELDAPRSPYVAAKRAAAVYARMFHGLGLPLVTLRPFMVYGPSRQDPRRLLPHVITALLRGESPQVRSGARLVDWIYLDDVVDAYLRAADAPGILGQTLDVGAGELVTIRDVVEQVAALVGGPAAPRYDPPGGDAREPVYRADPGDRAALGWAPTTPLAEGLARTVAYYREQRETP